MDTCHDFNLNVHPPAENSNDATDINHQKQMVNPQISNIEEGGNLMEVMSRIERENMKMIKLLAELFAKYDTMHNQLIHLMKTKTINDNDVDDREDDDHNIIQKKRKVTDSSNDDNNNYEPHENSSVHSSISEEVCCRRARLINYKPKVSTALIRIDQSDTTLVVKDGYQWLKYGQKVTRDNPSPRAYFKCSFAPLCPIKKKVQKSIEDPTILVVTYEGEHNHKKPPSGATLCPLSITDNQGWVISGSG